MSLFQRLFNYMVTEVLVNKLSDSPAFQRFAVRSTHLAQGAGKKAADATSGVHKRVTHSVTKSEAATTARSELDVIKSKVAEAKAEFVDSIKGVADKLNK